MAFAGALNAEALRLDALPLALIVLAVLIAAAVLAVSEALYRYAAEGQVEGTFEADLMRTVSGPKRDSSNPADRISGALSALALFRASGTGTECDQRLRGRTNRATRPFIGKVSLRTLDNVAL